MQRICFLVTISVMFVVSFACFAAIPEKIGTEEAAFLKIDAATRPSAMGGAFVGLANDVNSAFWNPAGLIQIEKKELTTMYNSWLAGTHYGSAAYAQPLGKNAAIAVSIQGLWSEIEKRTGDTEKPDSTFDVYSFAAGLSGGYALIPKVFSLGGAIKVINQDFDVDQSNGLSADVGGLIRMAGLGIGASVQNIKLQMSNEGSLPLSIRIGGAYQFFKDSVIAGEYAKFSDADPSYHIGLEKWLRNILALRIGYCISSGDNPKKGLSAGLGLRAYGTKPLEDLNFQLDYAYVPASDWGGMGDTHRVSMIVRF